MTNGEKITNKSKVVILGLVVLMIIQSCSVYRTSDKSLDVLAQNGSMAHTNAKKRNILVLTKDNRHLRFNRIIKDVGFFYGLNKDSSQKTILLEKDIESIRLKDAKASNRRTIISVTMGVGILFYMLYAGNGGQEL